MKYISLLRGINVSGQKSIKMADLKSLFEKHGLTNIVTYIQSGNVIFESEETDRDKLCSEIEKFIEKKYKFHVPVDIRTSQDFGEIIKSCPYNPINLEKDGTKVLVSFLSSKPAKKKVEDFMRFVVAPEKVVFLGQEVYLYCPNGYGKSKLNNNLLENKLGLKATTRNWKSVLKLFELVADD